MSSINSTGSSSESTSSSNSIYKTNSRVTGIFSSLDTDALVKSMSAGQQAKIDTVKSKQTKQEWFNDALTSAKADINEFLNTYVSTSGANSMLKAASYATYKAVTASTSNAASISASSGADLSDMTIRVNQLAKNSTITSSGKVSKNGTEVSSSNTATLDSLSLATRLDFGSSGNLSFAINGKTFTFSKSTTLQNMINTINTDTTANVTMKYSRLTDAFTLTSDSGGADSSISITNFTGNAFGLASAFKIGTGTFKNGTDSQAVINGQTVTRDSNEYSIDSISYNLKKVTAGTSEETVTFSLERDYSAATNAITKFVDAYNTLFSKLKALDNEPDNSADYPPLTDDQKTQMSEAQITAWETKAKSGILRHNTDLEALISNLKNAFFSSIGGTEKIMADIGITTAGFFDSNAGQLILNTETLSTALQNNADEVVKMFTNGNSTSASSEQGLMYRIRSSMSKYTSNATNSMRTAKTKISSYDVEIGTLEDKLSKLADSYYLKFSSMETALSKLNTQSSYISQMFGGLSK